MKTMNTRIYRFTYNGFHGRTVVAVRGPEQNPGTSFEISERVAKRIANALCPYGYCRCGEGHSLVEEVGDKRLGGRWVRRYFFTIPTCREVLGAYPQR